MSHFAETISTWIDLDTWTVVVAAMAAMSCALPGNYLLLRKQSMMGDALSHTSLLGVVAAYLLVGGLRDAGWISSETHEATWHAVLFAGAMIIGILTALLTELVQKLGRVESSAALGVVFITFFAMGLLLIRLAADRAHIDPDCVLYGLLETEVLNTYGSTAIPVAAISNGAVLLFNLLLVTLFYKELRVAAFDPGLATTLGINATVMHYALMGVTAATVVTAFESVGSILVIAMLIVPAATANLLTDRLHVMIGLSLIIAAASAFLGHVFARTLPPMIFESLGYPMIKDASTAGMMAVACGCLFVAAALFGPRHGTISKAIDRLQITLRIASEDVLGFLFRREELHQPGAEFPMRLPGVNAWLMKLTLVRLRRQQKVLVTPTGYSLTDLGRRKAKKLVRSHRLFEIYMSKHFAVPDDHLHETAARVEHFIDEGMREALATELDAPEEDPHGRRIPS
ncbi:MAG: metal ABC transporter permease [Planctomycetota bacterium]|nr:metal ABC transporter permease [Planctomycetota bacterium]